MVQLILGIICVTTANILGEVGNVLLSNTKLNAPQGKVQNRIGF